MLFLNRGTNFEAHPLSAAAQFARRWCFRRGISMVTATKMCAHKKIFSPINLKCREQMEAGV
jgi:hypothetical protein